MRLIVIGKMKICVVAARILMNSFGGMEVHANDLIQGLVQKGHKIIVISSIHPENKEKVVVNENLVYYFVGGDTLKSYKEFMKNSAVLYEKLRQTENFDVVYSESDFAMGLIKYCKLDIPLVVLHHGFFMDEVKTRFFRGDLRGKVSSIKYYLNFVGNKYQKKLLEECTRLIAINKDNFEAYERYYPFVKGRVRLVYNGVDIDVIYKKRQADFLASKGINSSRVMLFTGRLDKEKGIHKAIRVMPEIVKEYPDTIFIITGDGPYKNQIIDYIKKLNVEDNVRLVGRVPYDEIINYYFSAKILLFPTLRWEGLPYTLIEALACGICIVTSNFGGGATIVEDGVNGLLVDPHNHNEIVSAIKKIFADPELESKLRENAKEFAKKYLSLKNMVDSTESVIIEAVNEYKQKNKTGN
jgi:glycosyltransferase involved in cell wall biosynthesis